MIAGLSTLVVMPVIGKLSDKIDKFRIFATASIWMTIMVVIYTNLGPSALWLVIVFNVLMMAGIMGRMIPATALVSAVPSMQDRGAFMSINASLQQIAGGVAAAVAGMIVIQKDKFSPLEHYNTLGYIIVGITFIGMYLLSRVSVLVKSRTPAAQTKPDAALEEAMA